MMRSAFINDSDRALWECSKQWRREYGTGVGNMTDGERRHRASIEGRDDDWEQVEVDNNAVE